MGYLIKTGKVKNLEDILIRDAIKKTVLTKALSMNHKQFKRLMNNIPLFRLKNLFRMAELFGVEDTEVLAILRNQHAINKESKKAKK